MSAPLEHTLVAVTFERYFSGETFDKVPPHITILPWFDARGRMCVIDEVVKETEPFSIVRDGPMTVGGQGHEKKAVSVKSPALIKLHEELFKRLVENGVEFSHPLWLGSQYTPHYRKLEDRDPFDEHPEMVINEIAIFDNIAVRGLSKGKKIVTYLRMGDA
ncbi:MAG TPA: 2'-5' RNA ligase family protein [Candidatus Saccharimonadales bacterium]|nr:2'-5' RNA ligase family protein [Candidatus Saccharimonadales bacterium]